MKAITLILILASVPACLLGNGYKDNPATCSTNGECASKVCNLAIYECEPVGGVDSGQPQDGAGGTDAPVVGDGLGDSQLDTSIVADAPMDQRAPDTGVDSRMPDTAGTCGTSTDCTDPAKAFCIGGVCVGCQSAGANACMAPTSVCDSVSGKCVGCTADSQCTSAAAPICDKTKNACAACTADLQCQTKNAVLPACRSDGQCVQCTATMAIASCKDTTPACDTTTNTCVGCTSAANCSGTTPICGSTEKCQACAGDSECAGLNDPTRAACAGTGACVQCTATNSTKCASTTAVCNTATNKCVQCLKNETCSGSTPICATATNTCRGCSTATNDCADFAGHTACAATGACVQCTDDTTCSGTTPICNTTTNTCRGCTSDSECTGIGPGVCMLHQDSRCASDAETIVVTVGGTFPASVPSGKRLLVVRGPVTGNIAWTLSTPQMTIVGQNSGTITGTGSTPTLQVTGGDIYLRDLTISEGTDVGISVKNGTLRMDRCYVLHNTGTGILTTTSAFDIVNTVVAINGGTNFPGVNLGAYNGTGPTKFAFNTVVDNGLYGVVCGAPYTLTGILANGNNGLDKQFSLNCQTDTTTSTAAPAFSTLDYHLSSTSPCVNAGGNTCPPDDIDGDTRPQGAACDCGADEYKP